MTRNPRSEAPIERRDSGAIGQSPRGQLSDLLVRSGVASADDMAEALQRQDFTGKRLGTILIESGVIDESQLAAAIAHQSGLPIVDLVESEPSRSALAALDGATARSLCAIPLRADASILDVAVANGRPNTRERLEIATGRIVRLYVAPEGQIEALLDYLYPAPVGRVEAVDAEVAAPSGMDAHGDGVRDEDDATQRRSRSSSSAGWAEHICEADDPLASLLQVALATDVVTIGIDMFPAGTSLRLEYGDGRLETATVPNEVGSDLVHLAHATIGHEPSERTRAGSGRFKPRDAHPGTIVRIDSLPTILGHTLTLRVLRDSAGRRGLDDLGLPPNILAQLRSGIDSEAGLFVIAGQSGSGRTTTLHAIAREFVRIGRRVLLLEADQRQLVVGASQARLDEESPHLTIRSARSMDADVIVVDGIHDSLSARQALEGALDGALVFVSMHARSASDAIEQLLWLASEPTTLAGVVRAVRLVLAQTVVQKRCEDCRDSVHSRTDERAASSDEPFGSPDDTCEICAGPAGRESVVVFEALEPTPEMQLSLSRTGVAPS